MKICLVSPYDLSIDGGVNKHALYLAEALRAKGDEVDIIGPASGAPPDAKNVTCFGGVISIQGNESDNRIGLLTSPLAVRRYFQQRDYDVLHVHEPFVPSLPFYALWTTRARARVCTFHRYSEREAMVTRLVRLGLSPTLRGFQRGIAVSEAAARYAQVAWARPLAIIPNGVDTRFFAPRGPSVEREGGTVRLLFVGQWTDTRKGLPVLLEAYARLKARHVDVKLDVVGRGDPKIPMPTGIHGLTFHGRVSEAGLRRRLHECDIFVAPSRGQESFGIVLVEAMAAGRPVVCSDIEGYRRVVTPQGSRMVPPNDAVALADAIQALCRDAGLRRAMGQHNLSAATRYDWATLVPAVREEYALALGANAGERAQRGKRWTIHRRVNAQPERIAEVAPGSDEARDEDLPVRASASSKR